MERLLEVMRRLRAPDGCPWDRKQTHETLVPYLLEEAAEAADAILSGDVERMKEELGDVLLQVAFHSVIGEEEGTFRYQDVENAIVEKLIRRHPHVFGDVKVKDADEVLKNWEKLKENEGKRKGPCDEVPAALGALARAAKVQKKLGEPEGSREAVARALEAGDLAEVLWQVVAWARSRGEDPEVLLRRRVEARCSNPSQES